MIVVPDASAVIDRLFRGRFSRFRDSFGSTDAELHVPALCDIEVLAVVRRTMARGDLSEGDAKERLGDYLDLPLTRHGHEPLLARILQLRENFSAYDAAYVALAERLSARFATVDEGLRRATQAHLDVEVL